MLWKEQYLDRNIYTRPAMRLTGVRKIVMHDTANAGAGAINHFRYFNKEARRMKRFASAHIFIDQKEAICIVPLNEVAYHANDGKIRKIRVLKPNANRLSLGIELCLTREGKIHEKTLARAVDIVAELCRRYRLSGRDIVRHFDVTGKCCPREWTKNPKLFNSFRAQVIKRLEK